MQQNYDIGRVKNSESGLFRSIDNRMKSNPFELSQSIITPPPIIKSKSDNTYEGSNMDRFIPCRSYLESSHSLIVNNEETKSNKSFSDCSDTSRDDRSNKQNYNALLESQFFGEEAEMNDMNLS